MDLRQTFIDWNDKPFRSEEFNALEKSMASKVEAAAVSEG